MMLVIGACTSQKKLIYFQGAIPSIDTDSIYKIRIAPGDILSINIFTINTEAYPYLSLPVQAEGNDTRSAYEKGYLLNEKGEVKLPLVGVISLNKLTIPEATAKIEERFREYIQEPIVTIKKLNFKVTVLGEVNKPGTYPIMNEKVTLPELLGMAGDLTQFGDRKNLRIIREESGKRNDFFVDLTNSQSLSAASYYLHPDDIIYVSPVPRRAFQNINPSISLFASIITSTVVILTFIITTSK
jgi:polysaccharide export outer membrane protein